MNLGVKNINIVDYYFDLLRTLSSENKLDLIVRLNQSINKNDKKTEISLDDLFGAYKSEETAEEIIENLRSARTFQRNIESL